MNRVLKMLSCLVLLGSATAALAADDAGEVTTRALDEEVQALKQSILDINRELYLLEEDLLFPSSTQVSVFVSMDVGVYFALDSVQLTIDGVNVSNHLYTERDTQSLLRGGVQRLYTGNMPTGDHEIIAIFTGLGPNGREYRRGATTTVEKELGPKYIELVVSDSESKEQPEFLIKEW